MTNLAQTTEYIVQSSAACMPNSCWGRYRRVAVLEVLQGTKPAMISDRARGVVRVIETWEKCHDGSTRRCAASRAEAAAKRLADRLTVQAKQARHARQDAAVRESLAERSGETC